MAKILLVDDDEDILFLLEQSLSKAGHVVRSTSDPRRALPLVRSGRFDAIVLDVMMPKISGWDLLGQIREQSESRSTPLVLLTALSSVSDRVRGLRSGADDYLTKPFDPDELIARLEGMIERRSPPSAALLGQIEVQSIQEMLQQLQQGQKTGNLEITSDGHPGTVGLHRGMIVDADHGHLSGEDAILSLLDLKTGSFQFHPLDEATTPEGTLRLAVPPLLIRAAWIEDEFDRRSQHVPARDRSVRFVRPAPKAPKDLPPLPLEAFLEPLSSVEGSTVENLLRVVPAAPKRILLTLAWLAEEGCLGDVGTAEITCPTQDTPSTAPPAEVEIDDEDALEDFDVALRELLQAALFRQLSLDELELAICLEDDFHPTIDELWHSVPKSLRAPSVLGSAHRGSLQTSAGRLQVSWSPSSQKIEDIHLPKTSSQCAGIVLGLRGDRETLDLDALHRALSQAAPAAGCLLLAASPALRDRARVHFADEPRWCIPDPLPESMDQLLLALAQADPQVELQVSEPRG